MVSQYGHNQPWKVQVKILEEDQDDFKAVMSSSDFQLFNFAYEQQHTMVPFAISGKMLYKDQQVTLICTQKLTFLSRSSSLPKQWL